jgi:predicted MFS family arabinose efflux permease
MASRTSSRSRASGVRIARADPLIRRVLLILWTMSIFSLNFISFMPEHAQRYLDIHAKSTGYGLLYALFGLGAAGGAMSVGSFLASYDKARLVRPAMAAFAVMLGVFAALRGPALAYPVVFILGYVYFVAITSLSTVLQSNVSDAVRGRVMSLWIMGFGGAVGLAALVWGPVARDHLPQLLLAGAAWGVVLALLSSPERLRANQEVVRA